MTLLELSYKEFRAQIKQADFAHKSGPTRFIWSVGYALRCQISPFPGWLPANYTTTPPLPQTDPRRYCRRIKTGDSVWVSSHRLKDFIKKTLPHIRERFSLVISDGDKNFPGGLATQIDIDSFINDPKIIAIFAQNFDQSRTSPKLFHLPLGLDFHTINRAGGFWGSPQKNAQAQEAELLAIVDKALPTNQRIPKAFVDFHLVDRLIFDGTRRSDIFKIINQPAMIDVTNVHLSRKDLWERKSQYAFSISPHGHGLDCHRTWEDLALGCIVIVKTSALDPLYTDLPVAIVQDWREVTAQALTGWLEKFGNALANQPARRRLTLDWWMDRICQVTRQQLSG